MNGHDEVEVGSDDKECEEGDANSEGDADPEVSAY